VHELEQQAKLNGLKFNAILSNTKQRIHISKEQARKHFAGKSNNETHLTRRLFRCLTLRPCRPKRQCSITIVIFYLGMIMQISPTCEFLAGRTGELLLGLQQHLGPARGRPGESGRVSPGARAGRGQAAPGDSDDTGRQPRGRHNVVSGFVALRGPAVDLPPI
jgi:hypothetical protein